MANSQRKKNNYNKLTLIVLLLAWSSLTATHFSLVTLKPELEHSTVALAYYLIGYFAAALLIAASVRKLISTFGPEQNTALDQQEPFTSGIRNKSHEIRTPLNNIIGFVEMLEERNLDPDVQRQIHHIKESADALLSEIDALFNLPILAQSPLDENSGQGSSYKSNRNARAAGSTSKIVVLLVEDNKMSQEVTKHKLSKAGFEVHLATNGQDAVRMAKQGTFDFILMDCQMPGMDGFEATRIIRGHEQITGAKRIPIVALTAHAMEGYREICLSAGMDDYLTKPIKQQELIQFLGRFLLKKASEEGML